MSLVERMVQTGRFDVDAFMAFLEGRPDNETWQLVDGVAQRFEAPRLLVHQAIVSQLGFALNSGLRATNSDCFAIGRFCVRLPTHPDFQPTPDLIVVPPDLPDGYWTERFLLVSEIISPSRDFEMIDRKSDLYTGGPECQHTLVVAQDAVKIVHRARSAGWNPRELGGEDVLRIPELGFEIAILDLYKGTPLYPA